MTDLPANASAIVDGGSDAPDLAPRTWRRTRKSPRLRIAHVTATYPPYRGGTGNVCFHDARELARRGHCVHVFTAAAPGYPAESVGDGVHVHRFRPLVRVGNAPLTPQLVVALHAFDVIHLHYPFLGGEATALAARVRRIPLVITYHQDVLLNGLLGGVERILRASVGHITLRSAARVLFTSADYGRASHVRPMLRHRQIGALANGVDASVFAPGAPSRELSERYRASPGDRVVLLVAGLDRAHYFKGVDVLLSALAALPANVKSVIVGDGDLRRQYEAAAAGLGLADRVSFAGRVADCDLPDYYRLADVTVLPSTTMGEAFGLVLLESLASGAPVIASNLPGVRTVVDHGRDGLLVPPADAAALAEAISRVFGDEMARKAMGLAGRRKVESRYDWQCIGEQLEEVYEQVLAWQRGTSRPEWAMRPDVSRQVPDP